MTIIWICEGIRRFLQKNRSLSMSMRRLFVVWMVVFSDVLALKIWKITGNFTVPRFPFLASKKVVFILAAPALIWSIICCNIASTSFHVYLKIAALCWHLHLNCVVTLCIILRFLYKYKDVGSATYAGSWYYVTIPTCNSILRFAPSAPILVVRM